MRKKMLSQTYLDKARILTRTKTDYALAQLLEVSEQSVYRYVSGESIMDNDVARRVADVLGIDFAEIVAAAEYDRAPNAKTRARWREIHLKLRTPNGSTRSNGE
jgi:predicted transcriptional regulator